MGDIIDESTQDGNPRRFRTMSDTFSAELLVVFATHNGSDVLPDTLRGYVATQVPRCSWAMVVIDNGSTDETLRILNDFKRHLPLTILREPIPSKNRALNRLLDNISHFESAEFFIFTDDDAIPDRDYLCCWEEVWRDRSKNELFGAVVRPYFGAAPPKHLERFVRHFAELYAEVERPSGEVAPEYIFGPNMAVRRSVFARGHRFNEHIGPNSSNADYPMGSETEFMVRVSKDSPTPAWFSDRPKVRHIVRSNQTTMEFIARRAYRHGRGVAMRQLLASGDLGVQLPDNKGALKQLVRSIAARVSIGDSWWTYNWHRGYRDGIFHYHRGRLNSIQKTV